MAALGLPWRAWAFSSCSEWGLFSSCGVRTCGGFSCCRAWASLVVMQELFFFFFFSSLACGMGEGNGIPLQYSCLKNPIDVGAFRAAVHGVAKSQTQLSDFTFTFHFHALEKEMATHSSVLAWRILGTGEPSGLPSMGLHRVGHNWSDLVAAAAGIWDPSGPGIKLMSPALAGGFSTSGPLGSPAVLYLNIDLRGHDMTEQLKWTELNWRGHGHSPSLADIVCSLHSSRIHSSTQLWKAASPPRLS